MIARPWNHNIHYHDIVMRSIPSNCLRALDVGCGQGLLARQLGQRCEEVIAIDIDHDVLAQARANDANARSTYVKGDVMTYPLSNNSFDVITAVAALHHLPLIPALAHFRSLLRPGGVLVAIGLYRAHSIGDYALAAAAFPTSWVLRCMRGFSDVGAPLHEPKETLPEIRKACDAVLPGAALRRHLLFRYSLIWQNP